MYSRRASIRLRSFPAPKSTRLPLSSRIAFYTTSASPAEIQSAQSYCSSLLRKYDTPSYTLLAFIPPASQPTYLAIRAFNLELAHIPDTVSTPTIGTMRLAFWRDAISATFAGRPPSHPVTTLLSAALSSLTERTHGAHTLSKHWFTRIIAAREQSLSGAPYTTLDALERYAEHTYSSLLYLSLEALPIKSIEADHVASHIGKAQGIAAVLRGVPLLAFPPPPNHHSNNAAIGGVVEGQQRARQGVVALPLDVMAEVGVREEDVFRKGAEAEGLRDAVFRVATRASDHLITAREMVRRLRRGEGAGHGFEEEGGEGFEYGRGAEQQDDDDDDGAQEQQDLSLHVGNERRSNPTREIDSIERAFGVYMPSVSVGLWLERLQKVDFDIFRAELRRREWRLPWRAWWAYRRRKF